MERSKIRKHNKENKESKEDAECSRGTLQEIPKSKVSMCRKPIIIGCIREKALEVTSPGPSKDVSCLQEQEVLNRPVYMLNSRTCVEGVSIAKLDLLDTRNTFLWVETFRKKIIIHKLDEKQSMALFKGAVSKDIMKNIVKGAHRKSLRNAVRNIYNHIYNSENFSMLHCTVFSMRSSQFSTLRQYKEELFLLLRSYSVKVLFTQQELAEFLRKRFWAGLSPSIKRALPELNEEMTPEEIISRVDRFIDTCTTLSPKSSSPRSSLSYETEESMPVLNVVPMPTGIFMNRNKARDLDRAMEKNTQVPQNVLFSQMRHKKPFSIVAAHSKNCIGALLYQENRPVSFFFSHLTNEEMQYTETEKEMLAIDCAVSRFRPLVRNSDLSISSKKYRSFACRLGKRVCVAQVEAQ